MRPAALGLLAACGALGLAWSCSGEAPAPAPAPMPVAAPAPPPPDVAPTVAFRLPTEKSKSPSPIPMSRALKAARATLEKVVVDHARDPGNPWAVVHGMLALGPGMKLADGSGAVDTMYERYADVFDVGGTPLVGFPPDPGGALVEPHTDLILKALTESGFSPTDTVTVDGTPMTLADAYRYSLWKAWVTPTETSFQGGGFNDTPWALQALSAWAPDDLAWMAKGGHPMTMDAFTDMVVDKLVEETRAMDAARDKGELLQKDVRKGLFSYTCGGQHLLQGSAYAVARGFGRPENKDVICDQLSLLRWRIDVELGAVDPALASAETPPEIKLVLLTQRLKFLGHWLETTHKIGALGVCPLGPDDKAATERVAAELLRTMDALGAVGVWKDVGAVRENRALDKVRGANQVYLDLVGDSAHAVRGIDLATGAGTLLH